MLATNPEKDKKVQDFWCSVPRIGARWDGNIQTADFIKATQLGLLEYIEINFPIADGEDPWSLGLPILSHTADNPIASAFGISLKHAALVDTQLKRTSSPWTGEHLALLGETTGGALGYVINPPLTKEFFQVSCRNIEFLKSVYGHPIALELGPFYSVLSDGSFRDEYHFLSEVAYATECLIILDLTHAIISSKNLGRPLSQCLYETDREKVIELHVAGMRSTGLGDCEYWFDAHQEEPDETVFSLFDEAMSMLPNVKAVTLEYSMEGPSTGFFSSLNKLNDRLRKP